jgi:MFS family permease
MSIREAIDSAPISRFQIQVIGICIIVSLIDGFDILLMAFAASGVAKEFTLNGYQIGLLLSSGAVGMALGSAFIAPLADRIGRRLLSLDPPTNVRC